MFNDPGLRSKLAKLDSNFGQDVSVGSIMVDKSKIVTITTETKINRDLLTVLVKRRQMNMSDDEAAGLEDLIVQHHLGHHSCKILVLQA